MRVEYNKPIWERIYDEQYLADRNYKTIGFIYLQPVEWIELLNYICSKSHIYFQPKRVAILEPIRYVVSNQGCIPNNASVITTEELEFMGVKVRREYK